MADLVPWTDELSVGIDEIDQQHKVLVRLLNDLHEAIVQHRGNEACVEVLDQLVDYTRIHFAVEESLMRIFDYDGYDEHKAEHERLIDEVTTMRGEIESDQRRISFKLLHFLRNWLTTHIMTTDQAYSGHFVARGIQMQGNRSGWLRRVCGGS